MKLIRCSPWRARGMAALCLIGGFYASSATAAANFEGIWKISTPQASFKPEGGAIRFTELGKEVYENNKRYQAQGQYDEYDQMQSRCAAPGTPRIMLTPQRFQVFQRPEIIMIAFEWNRARRVITLPGLSTQEDRLAASSASLVGTMMGTSRGHWEGDTLIVNTDMFSEQTLIDDLVPHGYDMKVTERIRLKNANTLENRITVEDPEYFSQPWQTVLTYKRQPEAVIPEDVCLDRLLGPPPLATK